MTTHHQVHHQPDLESTKPDSVTSSPRSDHRFSNADDHNQRVRFMCSFGGKILPRPHDNQLRYVGGDTRMVAVNRHASFSTLLTKLSKLAGTANITVKYQLPNEDLDALITITGDEDVENMMEEYDRVVQNGVQPNTTRLRVFLFVDDPLSRSSSISSLLDGSTKREHWFLDALNGGAGLERMRSDLSSVVSEVPDYLFGIENSDPKARLTVPDNVSVSDPGSPAPVVSSPFCSTSSSLAPPGVPPIPDLRPVKTKPDNPVRGPEPKEVPVEQHVYMETNEPPPIMNQPGYGGNPNPMWQYVPDGHYPNPALKQAPVPVYYMRGPSGNIPVQIQQPYAQQMQVQQPGQIPVGYHQQVPGMGQVYGAPQRQVQGLDRYPDSPGHQQQVYYGVRNGYPGMMIPGGEERQGNMPDGKPGRVLQS